MRSVAAVYVFVRSSSCRHADVVVQKLRGKIGAVRPDQRLQLRMHLETAEELRIAQGFEHLSVELWSEVDLAGASVTR